MDSKSYEIFICLLIISILASKITNGAVLSNQSIPIQLDGATSNLTQINEIFVLVPTNTNLSDLQMNEGANFNLFKLDTDLFFSKKLEATEDLDSNEREDFDLKKTLVSELHGSRKSRKLPLIRGMWNKQKVSPLYLINGTVCRFVNTMPICTTLSTTGLLPTSGSSTTNQASQTARPATSSSQSSGGSSVQFANQQPRPSPIMDDGSPDFNVESSNLNSTVNSGMVVRGQQLQPVRQMSTLPIVQGARRPLNPFIMNRRPLNLMPFRRPVRQIQVIRSRTNEKAEARAISEEGPLISKPSLMLHTLNATQ